MEQQLKNAHWGLRENNNCASVLFYGNFFLISIEKKNCKCTTYKKRETERETAVFFFTRKKIFCRETKAKPLSEMQ